MKRLIVLAMTMAGISLLAQTRTKVTVEVEESSATPATVRKVALVVQNHAARGARFHSWRSPTR